MSVFITGTDTGVGKTAFASWLLLRLRECGLDCAGYKPICCGDRHDAELLLAAGNPGLTIDDINPVWLRTPASPLTAATEENFEIDPSSLRDGFVRLSERVEVVVVEGVGGWIVPITESYFSSDLAADLHLPVIVVAHNRLGCLNHILLTTRSIETAGLSCAGVVLNNLGDEDDVASKTNAEVLRRCLPLPIEKDFAVESTDVPLALREMLSSAVTPRTMEW